jgi:Zn-dependent protease
MWPRDRDGWNSTSAPRYEYNFTASPYSRPTARSNRRLTSPTEIRDMAAAMVVLTIAFFLVWGTSDGRSVLYHILVAALSVVVGFFAHEMMHKLVARKYGCWAEFRAEYRFLGLALLTSFFGFLFAAPGAVMIMGNIDRRQNGKISLAGPATNLVVALAFLPFALFSFPGVPDVVTSIAKSLTFFSVFLGAFNMIPVMPLDGAKIWHWNKPVYVLTLLAAGAMFFLVY